jgi:hypothetical protein
MPAENLAQKGRPKARLLATHDEHHTPQPALSHGQPAAVAWRLRSGRRRRAKPRHGGGRGALLVHNQRAKQGPSPHSGSSTSSRPCTAT